MTDYIDESQELSGSQIETQEFDIPIIPYTPQSSQEDDPDAPYHSLSSLPTHPTHNSITTRDLRLQIKTALRFCVSWKRIREELHVTDRQIQYANCHRTTPQNRHGTKPKINTPRREELKTWLLASPSHRHVPFRRIRQCAPAFADAGEDAISTAMHTLHYVRKTARKKGFSDDPMVIRERLAFAQEGVQWSRSRLMQQMFSDEVWAMGGAHTRSYVTVQEDNSDRFLPECLQHKYRKAPAWMFWGSIANGHKGEGIFWEKVWHNINSQSYDEFILSRVQIYIENHPQEYLIFQQDNAPSHRSRLTKENLHRRNIPCIKAPAYSPDLNLIEHVWTWMKNWIQDHYWEARYNVTRIGLDILRRIIIDAWNAVPETFITALYESWWDRCQAVIDAHGGPTRY